ncbi:unnamed protein product [Rotaria socialis]|nr:unnamed protein product [Rotaria socialis]CAF3448905.1 unnamed protein product [Rotaria socialis]CAF4245097.1 unnamed protein product [Rotaria socialis]
MSADGAESVIYVGDGRIQQRSVDIKDLDDDLAQQHQQQQQQQQQQKEQQEHQINKNRSKLLHKGLHHSYQEASTNLIPPILSKSSMLQQRSLSTNIPLVENYTTNRTNCSQLSNTDQTNLNSGNDYDYNYKIVQSPSFTRTASKKRREFSKDKRNASSNATISHTTTDKYQALVYQTNETNKNSSLSSSLQVRHPDLRRTKSDESRNSIVINQDESSRMELKPSTSETKSDTQIPLSTDSIVVSGPSSNHIRQHLSPNVNNIVNVRHVLQRSPSSTTPSATSSSQVVAFRSQRGSISFDTQAPLISSPATTVNKAKSSTTYSILPTCITKPRLKFSMVRDTAMASLGHNAPVYSMPITRDYSIDEKTNRIVNEFLMHDPSLESRKNISEDVSYRGTPKRHHHRMRQKTFEETISTTNIQKQSQSQSQSQSQQQQQPPRSPVNKQRHHSSALTNIRKHSHSQYPSVHLNDNNQQKEEEEAEEKDSSDPTPLFLKLGQSPTAITRRENIMAVESPSIIITGDDSGSQ